MLKRGELDRWVQEKDSWNHRLGDESMILALRRNPAPVDKEWNDMPVDEY